MATSNVVRSSLVALFVFVASGCSSRSSSNSGPNYPVPALQGAEQFTIYALEPHDGDSSAGGSTFHGNVILSQVEIKDAQTRAKISDIVNQGVRMGGQRARCFNPRHGVHSVQAGRTIDFVICYECSTIQIIDNGNTTTLGTGNVGSELDAAFQSAGVSRSR